MILAWLLAYMYIRDIQTCPVNMVNLNVLLNLFLFFIHLQLLLPAPSNDEKMYLFIKINMYTVYIANWGKNYQNYQI